jgi:hypothetical protein
MFQESKEKLWWFSSEKIDETILQESNTTMPLSVTKTPAPLRAKHGSPAFLWNVNAANAEGKKAKHHPCHKLLRFVQSSSHKSEETPL